MFHQERRGLMMKLKSWVKKNYGKFNSFKNYYTTWTPIIITCIGLPVFLAKVRNIHADTCLYVIGPTHHDLTSNNLCLFFVGRRMNSFIETVH